MKHPGVVRPGAAAATPLVKPPSSPLAEFRKKFSIAGDWDGILITDGSGTTVQNTMGWCGVLIPRLDLRPRTVSGCMSFGTNNMAELLAVLSAAMFITEQEQGYKEHGYKLYVISDSQYVTTGLDKLADGGETGGPIWASTRDANRPLWLALLGCQRKGLVFHARHIDRATLQSNKFCHDTANLARRLAATHLTQLTPPENWT